MEKVEKNHKCIVRVEKIFAKIEKERPAAAFESQTLRTAKLMRLCMLRTSLAQLHLIMRLHFP